MSSSFRTLVFSCSVVVAGWLGNGTTAWAQTAPVAYATADSGFLRSGPVLSATDEAADDSTSSILVPRTPFIGQALKTTFNDFRRLGSVETLGWLAIGAAAAGISSTVDNGVTNTVAGAAPLNSALGPGHIIGGKEFQFGTALATYAIGRFSGQDKIAQTGSRLLRAQFLAQMVTGAIKYSANRTRPDGTTLSFPSGHTSVSFASATVLQQDFGWKAGVPAYVVASYVALSRIEDKRHYLSDVAFGAAIGILAGRTVTLGSGDKKFALAPMATPGGAGVSFTWVGQKPR